MQANLLWFAALNEALQDMPCSSSEIEPEVGVVIALSEIFDGSKSEIVFQKGWGSHSEYLCRQFGKGQGRGRNKICIHLSQKHSEILQFHKEKFIGTTK